MEENKSIDRSEVQMNLYNALFEAYNSDKDLLSSYGDVVTIPRGHDDEDKDEEPSAGSNRGTKRRRSGKEAESSKEPTHKESRTTSTSKRPSRSQQTDLEDPTHQEFITGDDDVSPVRELDWHNPEGRPYSHDLSKPLPLILDVRGHQIIPYDHCINNDLEYLKGGSSNRKYTTSITKTKAVDYGHGPKCQRFYGYATNMETSKDVYLKHKIIAVTSLKIMEFFGYKHLEEITVRRQDDKLYKFREGDFKRLRHEDIEDMLLLLIQGKLTNLNVDERFALNVALRIKMTQYTAYRDIQSIIYQDDMDINHLMRTDELQKFSDGTLNHVRTSLNDIATGIQMEYLPKRKWTKQYKQRARVMIKSIDKKLKYRRFYTSAGNPVKEILLKLNLPDHKKLKDGGEEFDDLMPKKCAAGNTGVFVNGRELNQKDLDLLAGRGPPTTKDRSFIIDISGKVVDEDTNEELDFLGKLAPTVEKSSRIVDWFAESLKRNEGLDLLKDK
ncbi:hypothetical protein Tco_1272825 [Tanacetum coccineum]